MYVRRSSCDHHHVRTLWVPQALDPTVAWICMYDVCLASVSPFATSILSHNIIATTNDCNYFVTLHFSSYCTSIPSCLFPRNFLSVEGTFYVDWVDCDLSYPQPSRNRASHPTQARLLILPCIKLPPTVLRGPLQAKGRGAGLRNRWVAGESTSCCCSSVVYTRWSAGSRAGLLDRPFVCPVKTK